MGGQTVRWSRRRVSLASGKLRVRTNWMAKQKPSWETIAGKMAREGIVGAKGKPPAGHSVRRVWKRVLRDVAAERERELAEEVERAAQERELLTGVPAKKYPRDLPRKTGHQTRWSRRRGGHGRTAGRSQVAHSW